MSVAFARVIDNGRMLLTFVQILRSGAAGRKSLGSVPKAVVQKWLSGAPERKLIDAAVGSEPSLKDIVRMVHPKPVDAKGEAFYGWLLGKPFRSRTCRRRCRGSSCTSRTLPDVPFQMLTALGLNHDEWAQVAARGGWHMVRMNLNTFARHGVFQLPGTAECVAARLRDRESIERARAFPYQLIAAYHAAGPTVPQIVTNCRAPLQFLEKHGAQVDLVVLVSDNQNWVDKRVSGTTETMRRWDSLRVSNPQAKLVCIDLQPYGTTQAAERADVLNVGGFSDEVFEIVARFSRDELGTGRCSPSGLEVLPPLSRSSFGTRTVFSVR